MKLESFPQILWINLDKNKCRKMYMKKLLKKYNLNGIRISAIDGSQPTELNKICNRTNNFTALEYACTCSHMKALKYFIDNICDEKVIIFEDDVSFNFLDMIPYDWKDFEDNLPKSYNVIQLAVTNDNINIYLTEFIKEYYGSVAYLITKKAAKEIIQKYYVKEQEKYIFPSNINITSDAIITSLNKTYSIPIFSTLNINSIIHRTHLSKHISSKKIQKQKWETKINVYYNN